MTNPLTHLLWGYSISKNLSEDKGLIILGLISSIILDLDYLPIPGFKHHGFIHTPFFIIIICVLIFIVLKYYGESRSKVIPIILVSNLFFHLFLDTIGTSAPVMWLYPFSEFRFALGNHISLIQLVMIKATLFSIPLLYIFYCWYKKGENPFDLIEYLKTKLGSKITYILLIIFWAIIIYILIGYLIGYITEFS
jgi:hypothetical protein